MSGKNLTGINAKSLPIKYWLIYQLTGNYQLKPGFIYKILRYAIFGTVFLG